MSSVDVMNYYRFQLWMIEIYPPWSIPVVYRSTAELKYLIFQHFDI